MYPCLTGSLWKNSYNRRKYHGCKHIRTHVGRFCQCPHAVQSNHDDYRRHHWNRCRLYAGPFRRHGRSAPSAAYLRHGSRNGIDHARRYLLRRHLRRFYFRHPDPYPGTPASAATALDGYELTKQGKAGKALGTACIASFFGGLLSCISLTFLPPCLPNWP